MDTLSIVNECKSEVYLGFSLYQHVQRKQVYLTVIITITALLAIKETQKTHYYWQRKKKTYTKNTYIIAINLLTASPLSSRVGGNDESANHSTAAITTSTVATTERPGVNIIIILWAVVAQVDIY